MRNSGVEIVASQLTRQQTPAPLGNPRQASHALDPVCKIQFLDRVVCSVDGSIVVHRAHLTLEYECTRIPRPRGACMVRAGVATNRVDRFGIGVRLVNPSREVRQGRIGIVGHDAELGSHVVGGITCSVSGRVLVQHRNNVTAFFGVGSEDMTRSQKPYLLCRVPMKLNNLFGLAADDRVIEQQRAEGF
jgi:hypothetical protein